MFKHATAIGADIGRNSIRIAVMRMRGDIISSHHIPLKKIQTRDYIISELTGGLSAIRTKVAMEGINPICIGISAKGFVDHKSGIVAGPDQGIKDWNDVPLARIINQATGLPVFVGNDANMMTIAEHQFGVAKGYGNVIFVALRSGIGGGFIINGKLYRGVSNAGGEIGQMIINYDNGISDLGIRGSYEHLASASSVVRRYLEEASSGTNEHGKTVTCRDIFDMSMRGDAAAVKVVDENAWIVGIGLANLISIFAPEIIVVGGGMSEAGDGYLTRIRKSAFENSLGYFRGKVKIERAGLGAEASLIGSSYHALVRLAGKTI